MTAKIISMLIIWLIILVSGFLSVWTSLQWEKQPRLKAVLTACVHYEKKVRTPAFWQVTYEFSDSKGNPKLGSCKWPGGEAPYVGQEITICYNPGNDKSVIEGTYSRTGAMVLIVLLCLWGILSSFCILFDIDLSRRRG